MKAGKPKPKQKQYADKVSQPLNIFQLQDSYDIAPVCPYCFSVHVLWHDDGYCFCNECNATWNRFDYEE